MFLSTACATDRATDNRQGRETTELIPFFVFARKRLRRFLHSYDPLNPFHWGLLQDVARLVRYTLCADRRKIKKALESRKGETLNPLRLTHERRPTPAVNPDRSRAP